MNKLYGLLLFPIIINALQYVSIDSKNAHFPKQFSDAIIWHNDHGYHVATPYAIRKVQPWLINKEVRNMTNDQLKSFIDNDGYFNVHHNSGVFSLKGYTRGRGGGKLLGATIYVHIKFLGIGSYWLLNSFRNDNVSDEEKEVVYNAIEQAAQAGKYAGDNYPLLP